MIHGGKFSLVEEFAATCSHILPIYKKWLSKGKSNYIIEHIVSIIQLPLEAS